MRGNRAFMPASRLLARPVHAAAPAAGDCSRVRPVRHPWLKVVLLPLAVLVVYFVVPVDAERAPVGVLAGVLLSVGGAGAVSC